MLIPSLELPLLILFGDVVMIRSVESSCMQCVLDVNLLLLLHKALVFLCDASIVNFAYFSVCLAS